MRRAMHLILTSILAVVMAGSAFAEGPKIRAAVLKIGTVNWELDTIKRNGFDTEAGFELEVQPFADNGATRVALEGGDADLAVADWIWVARQRAAGQSLEDLAGKKIGIAGGPVDKSWLIMQAYATQKYGMDLSGATEQVFGAPPLIFKTALQGETDAAINFWHFLAKMKAGGMRELISVSEASKERHCGPISEAEFQTMKPWMRRVRPSSSPSWPSLAERSWSVRPRRFLLAFLRM